MHGDLNGKIQCGQITPVVHTHRFGEVQLTPRLDPRAIVDLTKYTGSGVQQRNSTDDKGNTPEERRRPGNKLPMEMGGIENAQTE